MKTYLSLTLMMISTFAWAIIPADTVAMFAFQLPQESVFLKGLNAFTEKHEYDSLLVGSPVDQFMSYGVKLDMDYAGILVAIPSEDECPVGVMFLEGSFDTDAILAQVSKEALNKRSEACEKMPSGGIYLCDKSVEKRVKALFAGTEKPISSTSAFAKLVSEKTDPKSIIIKALAKSGERGIMPDNLLAYKLVIVERTSGVIDVDFTLYAKEATLVSRIDAWMQGVEIMMDAFIKKDPALERFVNQVKTTVDPKKKSFSLSASVNVKELEMLNDAFKEMEKMDLLP